MAKTAPLEGVRGVGGAALDALVGLGDGDERLAAAPHPASSAASFWARSSFQSGIRNALASSARDWPRRSVAALTLAISRSPPASADGMNTGGVPTSSDWRSRVEPALELAVEHGVGDVEAGGLGPPAKELGDGLVVDQSPRPDAAHQLLDRAGDGPEVAADRLDQQPAQRRR